MNTWTAFAVGYFVLLLYFFLFKSLPIHSDEPERMRWRWSLMVIGAILAVAFLLFSPFSRSIIARPHRQTGTANVWVNPHSGFYYCSGTEFYGRIQPGRYMTQFDAIQSGYQPSLRQPCR